MDKDLTGRKVIYRNSSGKEYQGIVVGYHRDIGITIKEVGTNNNLVCCNKEQLPLYVTNYDEDFDIISDMIKEGLVTPEKVYEHFGLGKIGPISFEMSKCAFE